jgi:hypothetical protein
MPPTEAKDNLIWTSLLVVFAAIGTPPTSWRTAPVIVEGPPPDAIPPVDARPYVYLNHEGTGPPPSGGTLTRHAWRSRYMAYIAGKDARTVNNCREDLLQALYGAEGTLTSAYGQPVYPGPEDYHRPNELAKAGITIGLLPLFIDYDTDHTLA